MSSTGGDVKCRAVLSVKWRSRGEWVGVWVEANGGQKKGLAWRVEKEEKKKQTESQVGRRWRNEREELKFKIIDVLSFYGTTKDMMPPS